MRTPIPYCQVPADWVNDFSQCLYEWQAIIVAIPAIFIGYITVKVGFKNIEKLSEQIKKSEELEVNRLKRNFRSYRTILPIEIAIVNGYFKEVLGYCHSILNNDQEFKINFRNEFIPDRTVEALKLFTSNSDDKKIHSFTVKILQNLQYTYSRTQDHNSTHFEEGDSTFNNTSEIIILCSEAIVMLYHFFLYCRFETEEVPDNLSWEEVENHLMLSNLKIKRVSDLIQIYKKSSPYFWTADQ